MTYGFLFSPTFSSPLNIQGPFPPPDMSAPVPTYETLLMNLTQDGILTVSLNRPKMKNAFNSTQVLVFFICRVPSSAFQEEGKGF